MPKTKKEVTQYYASYSKNAQPEREPEGGIDEIIPTAPTGPLVIDFHIRPHNDFLFGTKFRNRFNRKINWEKIEDRIAKRIRKKIIENSMADPALVTSGVEGHVDDGTVVGTVTIKNARPNDVEFIRQALSEEMRDDKYLRMKVKDPANEKFIPMQVCNFKLSTMKSGGNWPIEVWPRVVQEMRKANPSN